MYRDPENIGEVINLLDRARERGTDLLDTLNVAIKSLRAIQVKIALNQTELHEINRI